VPVATPKHTLRDRTCALPVKLAIIQTTAPDYREPLWQELRRQATGLGGELTILAGSEHFDPTTVTSSGSRQLIQTVRNVFIFRRRLLVQRLPVRPLLNVDVVIAEANPRVLSTSLALILRKALGRRTLLWGHALSRRNSDPWPRRLMRRLSDGYVCYTDTDADYLSAKWPGLPVTAAPNALARAADIKPRPPADATNFIYVGRMVEAKRPVLLIQAFISASSSLPRECRLVMVGTGPLLHDLRALARASDCSDRIDFLGHIGDQAVLSDAYRSALAAVSPGYVGLSIIQAQGHGVPMVVADDEPHAPEIEATRAGFNASFFRAQSVADLDRALREVWHDREAWLSRAGAIARACADRYSLESQARGLWRAAIA
jgi:glycosyltransferase involved in cell wall biosynthesis